MNQFILSCCSTLDLSPAHVAERDISYICFHYYLDDVPYADDLGQSMPFETFYQKMVDGADTRTSQINMEEYTEYFEKFLSAGKDVLHVALSSGISGTYNSARLAAEDLRDEGKSIDEVRDFAQAHKRELHHWFFSTDLTFYIKGGRVSKLSGWFGTVLKICPLLNVDHKGRLTPRQKLRGKPAVIREIVEKMKASARDGLDYDGKCYLSHSACYEDARAVADLIEASFPKLDGKVLINSIGTTIGSHTGPGTVALFYWGDERVD